MKSFLLLTMASLNTIPNPLAVTVDAAIDTRMIVVAETPQVLVGNEVFPNTYMLCEDVNLAMVSSHAAVSKYPVRAQHGLTKTQIVENLKELVKNVLIPIKKVYPDVIVTSGFRVGNSRSQHERGLALDLQFPAHRKSEYPEIARNISRLVDYDQLILEHQTRGTGNPWIHISHIPNGNNRNELLTFSDHRIIGRGILG